MPVSESLPRHSPILFSNFLPRICDTLILFKPFLSHLFFFYFSHAHLPPKQSAARRRFHSSLREVSHFNA